MRKDIKKHINEIKKMFNLKVPDKLLYTTLLDLELKLHESAEKMASDVEYEKEEKKFENISKFIKSLLNDRKNIIIFNRDPRGYSIKIKIEAVKNNNDVIKDWGGYGIVAPK